MFPRNAATPPVIDLGQILQISDGAIQTTGASVRVRIGTGAWGAGAGTLACDTTSGIWTYAPTQAETNADYFIVGAYKASCTALSKTVITSASTTSGYAGLDWAKVIAATTTVNLSGTSVKTATDVETDTQDIQSRLPAALVSGRIDASVGAIANNAITAASIAADAITDAKVASDVTIASVTGAVGSVTGNVGGNVIGSVGSVVAGVTVSTNNDKTGYSLTQAFPSNFASLAITVGGAVTVGTNNDKTGYALTQSFPANFAALGINSSGHVSRVTLVDTTTTNSDMRGTDNAALASNWTATRAGYLDGVLIASNYNQRTVQVTGSNHVAADVHEFQPGVITSGDFASGAITSTVLATDSITSSQIAASAVTEIQSGLASQSSVNTLTTYVDTEVAAIKAKTDNLPSDPADASDITAAFTEIKGATWSSSTDTLEKIRDAVDSSGGGGGSIIVTPIVAQTPVRTVATNISTFKGDRSAITVGVFDELDPVDLTALGALEVCIQTKAGTDLQVIAAANITISGADNNYFSFSPGSAAVATVGRFMWSLRVAASNSKRVIAYGAWIVEDAALNDA